MSKKTFVLITVVLALLLTGCGFELSTDIYVQDVVDLPSLEEPLFATGTIAIGYSSEDRQEELNSLLTETLRNARDFRFEERNYSTNTIADFDVPMLTAENLESALSNAKDDLFSLVVLYNDDNTASVYAVLNSAKYEQLRQTFRSEYYSDISLDESAILVNVINDLRKTEVTLELSSVYADSVPMPFPSLVTVPFRDEVVVKFSDVLRDSLETTYEGDVPGFSARLFAVVELPAE